MHHEGLEEDRGRNAWAQVTMNLDCALDHSVRQPIKFHLRALRLLRGERLRFPFVLFRANRGYPNFRSVFWK